MYNLGILFFNHIIFPPKALMISITIISIPILRCVPSFVLYSSISISAAKKFCKIHIRTSPHVLIFFWYSISMFHSRNLDLSSWIILQSINKAKVCQGQIHPKILSLVHVLAPLRPGSSWDPAATLATAGQRHSLASHAFRRLRSLTDMTRRRKARIKMKKHVFICIYDVFFQMVCLIACSFAQKI